MRCTAPRGPVHLLPMLVVLLVTLVLAPLWVPDGLPAAHAAPSTWTVTTLNDDSMPALCIGDS